MTEEATETAADDHRPARGRKSFDCPRCGRWAHQSWSTLNIREWTKVVGTGESYPVWHEAQCAHCGKPSVWKGNEMVFPLARLGAAAHPNMPDAVRAMYDEASTVAAVSRRAGSALARATVEVLLKHLDSEAPRKATLEDRIERIGPKVSTPLRDQLDIVRVLGNAMLHGDSQPGELVVIALDDDEGPALVEMVLDTVNGLVDELIARPKDTNAMWQKLPDGIRAKLTERRERKAVSED